MILLTHWYNYFYIIIWIFDHINKYNNKYQSFKAAGNACI